MASFCNKGIKRRRKSTLGRQKIEIKKIENEDARHVSFSKRRTGLFTKASDLATLCGSDLAVLVYSPAGNPYSFGSPTFDGVADRFLLGGFDRSKPGPQETGWVRALSAQCMDLWGQNQEAGARKAALVERVRAAEEANPIGSWLDEVNELSLEQLDQLKGSLYQLCIAVHGKIAQLLRRQELSGPYKGEKVNLFGGN